MDFSPLFPHSSSLASVVSPDGQWVLSAVDGRLVLRTTDTLEVRKSWRCESAGSEKAPSVNRIMFRQMPNAPRSKDGRDSTPTDGFTSRPRGEELITRLQFSPRSTHALALVRRPTPSILVFTLQSDRPSATIVVGAEGVSPSGSGVQWAPGGDAILVWSDWGLRVTIWPLTSLQPKPLRICFPKSPPPLGFTLSPSGQFMAVLSRDPTSARDLVGIYDTQQWRCARQLSLSSASPAQADGQELVDATDLRWSPCGRYIALVESAIFGCRLEIRTPAGGRLGSFAPSSAEVEGIAKNAGPMGSTVSREPPQGLGLRALQWRPQGDHLAICGWDSKVIILNDISWTATCTMDLLERVHSAAALFVEPVDWLERTRGRGIVPFDRFSASSVEGDTFRDGPAKRSGVRDLLWSPDGFHLACRNEGDPRLIFVFSFATPSPDEEGECHPPNVILQPQRTSILRFNLAVQSVDWQPGKSSLWITCDSNALFAWHARDTTSKVAPLVEAIGIPSTTSFRANSLTWLGDGRGVVVGGRDAFCIAYPAHVQKS